MSDKIHCDWKDCDRTTDPSHRPGWYHVEIDYPAVIGRDNGPWDFCSALHTAVHLIVTRDVDDKMLAHLLRGVASGHN